MQLNDLRLRHTRMTLSKTMEFNGIVGFVSGRTREQKKITYSKQEIFLNVEFISVHRNVVPHNWVPNFTH